MDRIREFLGSILKGISSLYLTFHPEEKMLQTSNSPCANQTRIPKTPMRRFMCKLDFFRPNLALGKRSREPEHSFFNRENYTPSTSEAELAGLALDGHLNTSALGDANQDETQNAVHSPTPVLSEKAPEPARLAFQLHDRPLDAVVVTTLPRYPFVRHEELLTMPRQQLVEVALFFNTHLPRTIQIDCSDGVSASQIRHCIETLVGLIPNVPGAPKAAKSRSVAERDPGPDAFAGDESVDIIPSPPTSPLAMRLTKRQGLAHVSTSSGLESLEEEVEEDLFSRTRVLKRRKLSDATEASTRSVYETDMDITPIRGLKLSPKPGTSPTQDIWSQPQQSPRNTHLSPWTQSNGRSKVSSFNRSKSKGRINQYLRAPSPSGIALSAKDMRDEEVMSLAMSGLGSTSFYNYTGDNDRMDVF